MTTCERHPAVQTSLRCSKCEVPICPKCGVSTPVGMRCPDCASSGNSPLFRPSFQEGTRIFGVALMAGVLGSWIFAFGLGFYTLFLAFAYGYAVGEAVLKVGRRKRGRRIETLTGVAIAAGALGVKAIVTSGHGVPSLMVLLWPFPIFPAALGIAIVSAIIRIRYI